MSDTYRDKLRSMHFGVPSKRDVPKVTTDRHDACAVEVTEHFNDRVDVNVKPDTIRIPKEQP